MRYLFDDWDKLGSRLLRNNLALFLDYDGTLTPIAETPDKAVLPPKTKKLLEGLAKNKRYKLAIISGRASGNLKKMVGIPGIVYVGNHGLELEGPKIKFESPVSLRYKRILRHIKDGLSSELPRIKGAFIEDKGLSLSIHYRLVDKDRIPQLKTILHEATILYTIRGKVKIRPGKKVFEIRPAYGWDKGKIVLWLLARWRFGLNDKNMIPVYIGDDATDEDAFRALKDKGFTIFVGKSKHSKAEYYLKDTREVCELLKHILEMQKGQ